MTTSIKIHVNGQYRATVTQNDNPPVEVEGNYNGGSGERTFSLQHGTKNTFVVDEQYVKDDDKRPGPNDAKIFKEPEHAKAAFDKSTDVGAQEVSGQADGT